MFHFNLYMRAYKLTSEYPFNFVLYWLSRVYTEKEGILDAFMHDALNEHLADHPLNLYVGFLRGTLSIISVWPGYHL